LFSSTNKFFIDSDKSLHLRSVRISCRAEKDLSTPTWVAGTAWTIFVIS